MFNYNVTFTDLLQYPFTFMENMGKSKINHAAKQQANAVELGEEDAQMLLQVSIAAVGAMQEKIFTYAPAKAQELLAQFADVKWGSLSSVKEKLEKMRRSASPSEANTIVLLLSFLKIIASLHTDIQLIADRAGASGYRNAVSKLMDEDIETTKTKEEKAAYALRKQEEAAAEEDEEEYY